MDLKKIDDLFLKYSFKKERLYIDSDVLLFENVYVNKNNTEVYIVEKLDLNDIANNKIEDYQEEILWFENFTENYYLKYNMNLIILYDESNSNNKFRRYIEKYERDSSICKKIFLDIDNEDNLCILPFMDIEIEKNQETLNSNIKEDLNKILKSNNLIKMLSEYNLEEEYIKSNIINLVNFE